jgi:NADH:ubiquinone oxidoreductase subunit 6 (subunit J)
MIKNIKEIASLLYKKYSDAIIVISFILAMYIVAGIVSVVAK